MGISPGLATHLRGLADELLVRELPGCTLTRAERELLATGVSAANDCYYCMDSHGAFAGALLRRSGIAAAGVLDMVEAMKRGDARGLGPKMVALLAIARQVQREARALTRDAVRHARAVGATDQDVQLTVLIASAFAMYNRMVDGLRAKTPPSPEAYRARAEEIADHGYHAAQAIPR